MGQVPAWLGFLERKFRWLGIPNIAILLVTLQAIGFLFVSVDPVWWFRFSLYPELFWQGEYFRVITFLALPLSMSPIFVIFVLFFLYFVVNSIESEWGEFKTTLYVLTSILLMITFSLAFDYPVTNIGAFETTLFLAAATLYPEQVIQLFMVIPVKMKWLAWLSVAFLAYQLIVGSWMTRFYLVSVYLNYAIFFGPALVYRIKQIYRKWEFHSKMKR